ncbi:Fanconi anemia group A protein-like isoform X3 [Hypomesus transpacificus]|uniref:Fanconi anemia group A protein-like isoform X3 n=1 Tax=Hypomesus transpacificus TaxID=137520 RepID=UPI001F0860F8|nr:Fanconi anemia group A protein-like isoform X3 [Hypomesus transpacificus]
MSLTASSQCFTQKRTLSSLLSGRVAKKQRKEDAQQLQKAAVQLLNQHQNLPNLLLEVGNPKPCNVMDQETTGRKESVSDSPTPHIGGSLLVGELRHQAAELGVPVSVLSARMVLDRVQQLTSSTLEGVKKHALLNTTQRRQLRALLHSTQQLLSLGAFCSRLFWQEYWRDQKQVHLEVVYHLHVLNILTMESILESDGAVCSWLGAELRAVCGGTGSEEEEEEDREVRHKVLTRVLDASGRQQQDTAAELWVQLFDATLCGESVSPDALRCFFTHALTHTLTYRPRLTVSDAVSMQSGWSFSRSSHLLTALFRKLAVIFRVDELLSHLQQVLETQEVNWQHVLCFLSTLLVFNPDTQSSLQELLSKLLKSAFEGYNLESMITAFLLARQGALEGPALFPSYSHWFKMSFGGANSCHSNSKKSLVFLLKFLSDLVPFDPPQYLKVHLLHPPYVAVKHRSLLKEYVSLAKTRLADLKVSLEDMGLYEDVSGAAAPVQPQCQAGQDVEKAVSLYESTGRISATVMEASIFRRPYFLTRFLPALMTPRLLPVKADAQMRFLEALRKAEKIPPAQYSSYVQSCQRERQRQRDGGVCVQEDDDPVEVLKSQLQEFRGLVTQGDRGEVSSQLARMSHTLGVVFPGPTDTLIGQTVVKLYTDTPPPPELHVKVVNLLLRSFCQCLLDASRLHPPNRQSPWASQFVSTLLGHSQLLSALLHRLWDLLANQGPSLSAAHVLGLGAFVWHLHASQSHCPLVQLCPAVQPGPVPVSEALAPALSCATHADMLFCVRFGVAAVSYGLCRGDSQPDPGQSPPAWLCRKLLYLVPRLLPEVRDDLPARGEEAGGTGTGVKGLWPEGREQDQWSCLTDDSAPWRTSVRALWSHAAFRLVLQLPQCQVSFSEWLATELRVKRSEDALSDPERQEYHQWACMQRYLPCPVEQGGCGGNQRRLCSDILHAILDLHTCSPQSRAQGAPATGTCLPDLLCTLQEVVYEMELTGQSQGARVQAGHFLLDVLSQKCPLTPAPQPISSQLSLQQTVHAWNRVLLSLPAVMLVTVRTEAGRTTLDCQALIDHVNLYQRQVCSPAGSLPHHLTAHLLKGVLSASMRCEHPSRELNQAWSQISLLCPLFLVSAVRWWGRLRVVLECVWRGLSDGDHLPEQLQLLQTCCLWAPRLEKGVATVPTGPPLLLAATLHSAWTGRGQSIQTSVDWLCEVKERQVLVYLLYLCVTDLLTTLLHPQEVKGHQKGAELCPHILSLLVPSSDWLLLFKSPGPDQGLYQSVAMVTSDEHTRLMPLAFYSLVLQLSPEDQDRTGRTPGFLQSAVLCYVSLLNLFLDGSTPQPIADLSTDQMDLSQILGSAQRFLLRALSVSSAPFLSSSQLTQLEALCSELDPAVAGALSAHLCQDMDFL